MAKTAKGTGQDNRQKIIDTAIAMIGQYGVEKTSLSKIAQAAGLSKGTIYYYYASKNDLIFDIADFHMGRMTSDFFEMIENEPGLSWERLLTAFFETLLHSRTRSRLHLYLVREAVSGNGPLKKRFQKTYAQWFDMADQAQMKMPGPKIDVSATSSSIAAIEDGFILQVLLETRKTSIQKIVRITLNALEIESL